MAERGSSLSGDASARDATPIPTSRKRKRRPQLSCAECRRLKLRCDRQVPCANCVRRSCRDLCPGEERSVPRRGVSSQPASSGLSDRVDVLEDLLQRHGLALPLTSNANDISRSIPPASTGTDTVLPPNLTGSGWRESPSRPASRTLPPRSAHERQSSLARSPAQQLPPPGPVGSSSYSALQWSPPPHMSPPSLQHDGTVPNAANPNESETAHIELSPSNPTERSPQEQSFGTLVISHSGRSKYLGPSAASEWLKDQEIDGTGESPGVSRAASPERIDHRPSTATRTRSAGLSLVFPFTGESTLASTTTLIGMLPPEEEARILIDSYYRYFAWSYDIAPRRTIEPMLSQVYDGHGAPRIPIQRLALLFIILAMGALHNLELLPDDSVAGDYLQLAKTCLVKGDFMTNNTIAGVQTLHIMAHFQLETEKGRNGDSAWPLWGLAMRTIQAMGLHRDGERWNLPADAVEERRRVFWECHSAEVFQANCFSRPSSISPAYLDTAFPAEAAQRTYSSLKFELSQISGAILHQALTVEGPPYLTAQQLYERLCHFERQIPFHLRCRASLLALPSVHIDSEMANADSPEVSRRDLKRTFEQYSLALMISEAIVNLHRPYFIRAMQERPEEPTQSTYGQAFLSVIERSNVIIQMACGLYALHPNVTARHWWTWYHAFNSAVCMGTMTLMNPQNVLCAFALDSMDQAIASYTSIVQIRTSPRLVQNLQWLLRLRNRAVDRINHQPPGQNHMPNVAENHPGSDTELLGWQTRLIERGTTLGIRKTTTIPGPSPGLSIPTPTAMPDPSGMTKSITQAVQQHLQEPSEGQSSSAEPTYAATDQFLQQFWDPMMLHDFSNTDIVELS